MQVHLEFDTKLIFIRLSSYLTERNIIIPVSTGSRLSIECLLSGSRLRGAGLEDEKPVEKGATSASPIAECAKGDSYIFANSWHLLLQDVKF